MTFTYVGDLSTELDQMRFAVGDTTAGSGPWPGGTNFTDEELNGLNDAQGTWERAVGMAFGTLAAKWATYVNMSVGPRSQSYSQIAKNFATQAKEWQERHGVTTPARIAGIIRVDGYSDDVPSDDVTPGEGEFAGIGFVYLTVRDGD